MTKVSTMNWLKISMIISVMLLLGMTAPAMALVASDELPYNKKWTGDFDKMSKKRGLRVLMPYSKTNFFLDGATEKGLGYEAVKGFEKYINDHQKNKHLQFHIVIIPTERESLLKNLREGLGDIATGNLTITDERLEQVDFSDPFLSNVREIVVTEKNGPDLKNSFDLAGKEIYVRKTSSYYDSLLKLNEVLKSTGKKPIKITLADEHLEDEDLLEMINAGAIPMIIVDRHKAEFWTKIFDNIKLYPNVAVRSQGQIGWAIRKNSPQLKKMINGYVKKNKKGTLHGNIIFNRYLKNTKYMTNPASKKDRDNLIALVKFFKKYAKQYDFNYLMLTALAYQESRLNPKAKSHVGAVGVMQILPSTAKDKNVNIPNVNEVEANIHAGTKYLRFMADRYFADEGIDRLNRGLLSFASYNAGPARVTKLRNEAKKMGLDPNVWFENVEIVAAKRIGRETVQYVSNIYKYYVVYAILEKQGKL